jgi:hypothetical protein
LTEERARELAITEMSGERFVGARDVAPSGRVEVLARVDYEVTIKNPSAARRVEL